MTDAPFYDDGRLTLHCGDSRTVLPSLAAACAHCCVTSPPYWGLRDYNVTPTVWADGSTCCLGREPTPELFVAHMVEVFRAVRRVLKDDGTLWVNIGDTYQSAKGQAGGVDPKQPARRHGIRPNDRVIDGLKAKDLVGIPWMLAFALRADGWYLRQDIIWSKPNPMTESIKDRCTKSHEYLFLLSKSNRYYFDADAISEPVADSSIKRWSQPRLAEQAGSGRVPGKNNGSMKAVGGMARPQARRAIELAREHNLTDAHIRAIRACGLSDAGKNRATQSGAGKNDPTVQALANEAKAALGGYYREFLTASRRNRRSVWTVSTRKYKGAHFATFPPELVEPCILAGSPVGGLVLDPFNGSGTTGQVAQQHGRRYVGIELNPDYLGLTLKRISQGFLPLVAAS